MGRKEPGGRAILPCSPEDDVQRHNGGMAVVQLFVTCLIDTLFPDVGESVVRSLRRAGADVLFGPEQTCCGQPAFNVGYRPQALPMAPRTSEVVGAIAE